MGCLEGFFLKTRYRLLHVLRLQHMHALEKREDFVLILTHFPVAHRKYNTTTGFFLTGSLFKQFFGDPQEIQYHHWFCCESEDF
jgi:hypothetical protein